MPVTRESIKDIWDREQSLDYPYKRLLTKLEDGEVVESVDHKYINDEGLGRLIIEQYPKDAVIQQILTTPVEDCINTKALKAFLNSIEPDEREPLEQVFNARFGNCTSIYQDYIRLRKQERGQVNRIAELEKELMQYEEHKGDLPDELEKED